MLPEGWESDYDGTRWFYTYKPTGHVQYHFPKEGDEFPDFIDAFAPAPVLAPEERLESRRQTTATGGDKASAGTDGPKARMSASARPVDEVWDEADDDDDKNGKTAFQPDSFMYLGPGTYTDVSPLAEDEDEAAKRVLVGPVLGEADAVKNISPVASETPTPQAAKSEPVLSPTKPDSTKIDGPVPQATGVKPAKESTDQLQDSPPPAVVVEEPAAAMIDGREMPHELPVAAEPRFDPVGIVAEMATEHTAAAYIEIHPDPVEMSDNLMLAPIETAAPFGIAELPEKSSPVGKKHGESALEKQQQKPESKSEEPQEKGQVVEEIVPRASGESIAAPAATKPREEDASNGQPPSEYLAAAAWNSIPTEPSSSHVSSRKPIGAQQPTARPDMELHDKAPKGESGQQTLTHVPSVLKPVRHALYKDADQTPAQPVSSGSAEISQQSLSKHPSVLQPARGRAMSQTAQQTATPGQEQRLPATLQGPQLQQQSLPEQSPKQYPPQENTSQQQPAPQSTPQQYLMQQIPPQQQQQHPLQRGPPQQYPPQQGSTQPQAPPHQLLQHNVPEQHDPHQYPQQQQQYPHRQHPQQHQSYPSQPQMGMPTWKQQPVQHQASRPDIFRSATEPVQHHGQDNDTISRHPQQQPLLRPATVMPPLGYQPRLLPEQRPAPAQPYLSQYGPPSSEQASPSGLGLGPARTGQPMPNPPYPLSDLPLQFSTNPMAGSERRPSDQAITGTRGQNAPQYSPQHQPPLNRAPMPQGEPRHSLGNVSEVSLSSPSSISQSPGFPLLTPSPMSQTPGSPPHLQDSATSLRKPLARSASVAGPPSTDTKLNATSPLPQSTPGNQQTSAVAATPGASPSPSVPSKIPFESGQQQYFPIQDSQAPAITVSNSPSVRRTPVGQPRSISKRHSLPAHYAAEATQHQNQGQSPPAQFQEQTNVGTSSPGHLLPQTNAASYSEQFQPQTQQPTTPEQALGRIEERVEPPIPREASPLSIHSGYHTRRHSTVSSIQPSTYGQITVDYPSRDATAQGPVVPTEAAQGQHSTWQPSPGQNLQQGQSAQYPGPQPQHGWAPPQNQVPQGGPVLQHEQAPPQGQALQQAPFTSQNPPASSGQPTTHEWMSSQGLTPLGQLRPQQRQSTWTNYMSSSKISGFRPRKASAQTAMDSTKAGLTSAQATLSKNMNTGVASAQTYVENLKPGVASAQAAMKNNLKPGVASAQTAINSLAGKSKDKFTKLRKSPKPRHNISAPQQIAESPVTMNGMAPNPDMHGHPQPAAGAGGYSQPGLLQGGSRPEMTMQPNQWNPPIPQQQLQTQAQQSQYQPQYVSGPVAQATIPTALLHHHQQQQHHQHQHQQQYPNNYLVHSSAAPTQVYQQETVQLPAPPMDAKIRRKPPPGQGPQIPQPESHTTQTQPAPPHKGPLNSHPVPAANQGSRNSLNSPWMRDVIT